MRRFLIPTVSAGLCALLVLCLLQAPTVQAHSGATGVVKERMALMKRIGGEMKKIAAMFKGDAAYDPGEIAAAARRIEDGSGGHMLRLFPEGSTGHPSEAKDGIWRHWPEFETRADELGTEASALAAVADTGEAEARTAFGRLAKTCKACHQDFKSD